MNNYLQDGDILTLTPTVAVPSGGGNLFGASLFAVATAAVPANTPGEFKTRGVVTLPKTVALAISQGDRLFWDGANKVVNKTAAAQQCVGVALADAANGAASVTLRLGAVPPVGS